MQPDLPRIAPLRFRLETLGPFPFTTGVTAQAARSGSQGALTEENGTEWPFLFIPARV